MDLHLHTPASKDYQQSSVNYLDILQRAEQRGLDIMAFTDHNTVRGYQTMAGEFQQLEWLEKLGRITADEKYRLDEYRRLFQKILVLPGFEFTATFGFHILGVFSPHIETRALEHLLLDLNIPAGSLDEGETNIGASADVLTAYQAIHEAGGIVIAAHANSNHGVAMRGLSFGGQTRIAYTQDSHLHALEVTDLDRKGRRTTARFFDGSKPEYPRPMRCVQGSDAHRLERDGRNGKNLGIGERVTEVLLPELTFEALYEVFNSTDLTRTRPYRGTTAPYDHIVSARQEGPSIVQDFHKSMSKQGGDLYAIVSDICAFANTQGGTLYIGVSANPKEAPARAGNLDKSIEQLKTEVQRKITPPVEAQMDIVQTQGVPIIRVQVPRGSEPPYAIDDNKIYVRDETETSLAVRDEIVQLVLRGFQGEGEIPVTPAPEQEEPPRPASPKPGQIEPPRTGVEVVASEKRNGIYYHSVRDLRNGNVVRNVTRQSARKLWHYAITQVEEKKTPTGKINWQGNIALVQSYSRAGKTRYDLAQREGNRVRIYYGVTEDGIQDSPHAAWRELLGLEDED